MTVESYAAARGQRVQRLVDLRRLRSFVGAVEAYCSVGNKEGLDQILGLKPGRGRPVDQDRRDKTLEKLLEIVLLLSETFRRGFDPTDTKISSSPG